MNDTRSRLMEALAILGSLSATVQAQEIQRLDPPIGCRWAAGTGPAISSDGQWLALAVEGPTGIAIERRHGLSSELLGFADVSGVRELRIATDGSVHCNVVRWSEGDWHEWSVTGPLRRWIATTLFDMSDDGETFVATAGGSIDVIRDNIQIRTLLGVGPWGSGRATAANSDAWVVVGDSSVVEDGEWRRIPWIAYGLATRTLPRGGWDHGTPRDLSNDGGVAVGDVTRGFVSQPAIWIGGTEPIVIASEGSASFVALGGRLVFIERDGSNAVWNPWSGVRSFTQIGLPSDEPSQLRIESVSDDGERALAWFDDGGEQSTLAKIIFPQWCPVDYATDGLIDFFDLIAFVDCFEGNCPNYRTADFTMDGFVDWADFAGFVEAFETGC